MVRVSRDFCVGLFIGILLTTHLNNMYQSISTATQAIAITDTVYPVGVANVVDPAVGVANTVVAAGVANTVAAPVVAEAVENWEDGIDFEVDHHSKWLRGELEITKSGWFKYERETKLQGLPINIHQKHYCELFSKVYGSDATNQINLLLDHGAGPFTNLGKRFSCDYEGAPPDVKGLTDRQVIAVDPLAPKYNGILTQQKVFNTLRTAYCPSEELTKCIGQNTVDFAIIINALDHSKAPLAAFMESLKTVRVGGISCVYTLLNEASSMGGAGFHQWNFKTNESSEWIIENFKSKAQHNVDNTIRPYASRIPMHVDAKGQDLFCYKKIDQVN